MPAVSTRRRKTRVRLTWTVLPECVSRQSRRDVQLVGPDTRIGVMSWTQLCACTKRLSFGDSARGLRSWTMKTRPASSTTNSCMRWRILVRSASSKVACTLSFSASNSLFSYQPQFSPTGPRLEVVKCLRKPETGSSTERLTLMASTLGFFSQPPQNVANRAFQSITSNLPLKPAASSCALASSFIGSGCIWPEPEVEMPMVMLQGRQLASFSSALALLVSKVYLTGLPWKAWLGVNTP